MLGSFIEGTAISGPYSQSLILANSHTVDDRNPAWPFRDYTTIFVIRGCWYTRY